MPFDCYTNSLPGILVSDGTATAAESSNNCSSVIDSSKNLDAAGITEGNMKTKIYASPQGDVDVAIEGPISNINGSDPVKDGYIYGVYISMENAREKVTFFKRVNHGQSDLDGAPVVKNAIIFAERDSQDPTLSYIYLRLNHKNVMMARGTYVVRIYKSTAPNVNTFDLLSVFTITVKSDPIQGAIINKEYINTANRLFRPCGNYAKYLDQDGTTSGGGDVPIDPDEKEKANVDASNLSETNVEEWKEKLNVETVKSSTFTDSAGDDVSYTQIGTETSISEVSGNIVRSINIDPESSLAVTLPQTPNTFTVFISAGNSSTKFEVAYNISNNNTDVIKEIISGDDLFTILSYDKVSGEINIQNLSKLEASVTISYQF